jgi:O-antigen/teichoic acid export membrane protein
MNVEGVIYGWIISVAILLGVALLGLMKKFPIRKFDFNLSQFLKSLRIGSRALWINLLGQLLLRSDLFLINWYLGLKAVGYYSVGVALAELVFKIPGIAGDIVFPKVASGDALQSSHLVTKITRFLGIPLLFITFLLIIFGKPILSIVFGWEFTQAYIPMIWILLGTFVLSYHVILDNYFAGKGYPAITIWAPGLTLVVNIGLNLFLIPLYGISGAAMASCFAYIFLTVIKLTVFCQKNKVTYQDFFIINRQDVAGLKMIFNLGR